MKIIATFHSGCMVAARVVLAVLSATHHLLALWALDFEDILCHLDAVVDLVERVGGPRS